MPNKKNLPTFTGLIQTLAATLTIISILGGGIIYYYYNTPSLKYETIPAYDFDEMSVSGISIRNEGHSTAHEITVSIELNNEIKNFKIATNEPYNIYSGGKNQKNVGIKLGKLVAGSSLSVYLLTNEQPNIKPIITYENGLAEPATSYSTITSWTFWSSIAVIVLIISIAIYILYRGFKNFIEDIRVRLNTEIIDKSEDFNESDWLALGLASSNLIKKYLKAGEIKNGRTFQYHLVKDFLVPAGKKNAEIEKSSIYELAEKAKVTNKFADDLLETLNRYLLIEIKDSNIKVTERGKKTFHFVLFYLYIGLESNMFRPLPS